ncbi:hypothetical protein D9757_000484 [Collybiopsis confluens]|uniref:Pheromone receptor n=1 Tax=Collybiopsis confluens TaxID=2823264 RepID=A0A8H5MGP7_9AGAR|nr:hypothetical protein D9757_000484 [Collybiopsis confluens]
MRATDPTFPLYPILSFIAIILSFIPFPWHFRARNVGTCAYMLSTGFLAIVGFINSIIWKDNVNNIAPVWCDISAQIIIACNVGLTASTLAISRQLYDISKVSGASKTPQEKRRDMIINSIIAFGLPVLVMGLHFIVQPRRFDIFEQVGCQPATFNTLAAYLLFFMWPILIGLCSLVYSILTLRNFISHRIQFAKLTTSNESGGMSPSRYMRLMLLVFVDMICNTPIGVFTIIAISSHSAVLPFSSKSADFTQIELVPASVWKADMATRAVVEIGRWVPPVFCAFVFFAFFGFADEAKKNYKKMWIGLKRLFGKEKVEVHVTVPKPKSRMWSMISSNARPSTSYTATESTLAPSYYNDSSTNDKFTPEDSVIGSPCSLASPPSYAAYGTRSLRPLITGTPAAKMFLPPRTDTMTDVTTPITTTSTSSPSTSIEELSPSSSQSTPLYITLGRRIGLFGGQRTQNQDLEMRRRFGMPYGPYMMHEGVSVSTSSMVTFDPVPAPAPTFTSTSPYVPTAPVPLTLSPRDLEAGYGASVHTCVDSLEEIPLDRLPSTTTFAAGRS